MKLIDAKTGNELRVGQTVKVDPAGDPTGYSGYTLLGVTEGVSTVTFLVKQLHSGRVTKVLGPVRYLHPQGAGIFSRVGIFPS